MLGPEAGVDFPVLLFEDQLGPALRAPAGTTGSALDQAHDGPADVRRRPLWAGRLTAEALRTFARDPDVEAVFSREDPGPGLAEVALLRT